jgi:hypothetical protein
LTDAAVEQPLDDRRADAARPAGHERALALEVSF